MALVKNGLAALPGKQSFKLAVVCLCLCSFSPSLGYFLAIFFGNVIRRVQVWGHVVRGQRKQILITGIFKVPVYCCQYFVNDLSVMRHFLQRWIASLCRRVGGAALTRQNLSYFVVFIYYLMDRLR